MRSVKTSVATAVQVVHSNRRGARKMEHLESAPTEAELELLKAAARQKQGSDTPHRTPALVERNRW